VEVARAGFRNRASIAVEPVEIEICGDWAFVRTLVTGTVKLHGSGETVSVNVKQLEILRRQQDGWRIARLMMNGDR
jgi:ketosteroid isomerase-like protein